MNAREPQSYAHARWEYTWFCNYDRNEASKYANKLGSEGWEMVNVRDSGGLVTAWFKRPVY